MPQIALAAILAVIATSATADQTVIPNYRSARDTYFYNQLYPFGGWTIYCGEPWLDRMGLNVEHVYPASWMKETAGCAGQSRSQCRVSSDRFNRMEADLHNLYAALAELNQARSNYTFAIIGADDAVAAWGDCDFEIDAEARECEPRPIARGNFARAIFYMRHEYGAPIDPTLGTLLIAWHRADPGKNFCWAGDRAADARQCGWIEMVSVPVGE